MTWGSDHAVHEDWEEELTVRASSRVAKRFLGAASGMLKAACVAVSLIALLAIIPGGLTRFADLRRSVLEESVAGMVTQVYWYPLTPEVQEAAGRAS